MQRYELWRGEDDKVVQWSFFLEANDEARDDAVRDGLTFVWEVTAGNYNEACQAMHDHLGWEPYQPFEDPAHGEAG